MRDRSRLIPGILERVGTDVCHPDSRRSPLSNEAMEETLRSVASCPEKGRLGVDEKTIREQSLSP
jgi:hypothetical protein